MPSQTPPRTVPRRAGRAGFSLVEVLVAFALFAILATGTLSALIQSRRMSTSNLAESYADTTAQGIVEQVVSLPPGLLADPDEASVRIKLATLTAENHTTMDDFVIPWADDVTSFTALGASEEGVLTDAAYIADEHVVRPERYMPVLVNLQRQIEEDENRIHITLRYRWALPDRRNPDGSDLFLEREIRTIRSLALRF